MKKYSISITILLSLFICNPAFSSLSEKDYLNRINELAKKGENGEMIRNANEFFKRYPQSNYIADVRLLLAENETDADKAINQFRILVDKYRYFEKRDIAQYRICEILYLMSKWKTLENESIKGIRLFRQSEYTLQYKFFLAKAYIQLEKYDAAKNVCLDIIERDHSYNTLSSTLILLSYINRNILGLSRSYLNNLNEIITGFGDSSSMPAALFLLGRYYESKADYNKAYSAYTDLVRNFPRSPEARFSDKQLDRIAKYNPVKTGYLPDKETIRNTDRIDIQPEIDIDNNDEKSGVQYSISLGPFDKISSAREIKKLINKDFRPVEIAGVKNGYMLYAGKFSDIDMAANTRIRLAEEFGINGNIVRIIKDANNIYIYEE
ncbi:MAG: tetratricopeptide repeat protein [Spirochaetes bacterium]|nr:tetratricopeptide repeat protein [Spirochaetota bacterium]